MKLIFLVNKQTLTRVDKNILVADSSNYVCAQFVFDFCDSIESIYDRAQAIFWKDGETKYIDLDGISGDCSIPDEFITAGSFKISLLLSNGDINITTSPVSIDVKPSGFTQVTKPDVYSKLVERIDCLEKITGKLIASVDDLEERVSILEGDQNDNDGPSDGVSEPDNVTDSESAAE